MSDLGNKQIFSKNLRNIMDERQVTRRQICSELGFVYSTFSDWYNGKKYPRIDKIEMIANYFGIKKSDLIEEQVPKESDTMSLGNKETMAKNIRRLMALNQVNATDVCAALGFKAPTFSDWVNAKTYPRIDKIEAMSNYFGVSKADLVEEQPPSNSISLEDIELLKKFHALDGRGRSVVESVLNAEYEHQQPTLHVVAAANGQRAFFEERDDLPPLLPEDPPDV